MGFLKKRALESFLRQLSLGAVLVFFVGMFSTACRPSSDRKPLDRCYDDHYDCGLCCALLKGSMARDCEASCDCVFTCCKEENGAAHVGSCDACKSDGELFVCEMDKATDKDGDGYNWYEGDCDEDDPTINPGVAEIPGDGIDNTCNGWTDADIDGDGYRVEDGDCDDNDASVFPGAPIVCGDGKDNNCNGFIDEDEPDTDGDGVGPCAGDCNDGEPAIGPNSIEDPEDEIDNNCNGLTDEPREGCDCVDPTEESVGFAEALELCNPNFIRSIETYGEPEQMDIFETFGSLAPRTSATHDATGLLDDNCHAVMLCSGEALDIEPQSGTSFGNSDSHPLGGEQANDLGQIIFNLLIPYNVVGVAFDFMFLSSEYPEYVCTQFNDAFLAILEDPAVNGGAPTNISFDGNNKEITVNNNFFENPNDWSQPLTGTGYDVSDSGSFCSGSNSAECTMPNPCPPDNNTIGSGTGWLRTTAPVTPGSETVLTFSIHDEGDGILDSCVIIDNFRWITTPVDGPGTVK